MAFPTPTAVAPILGGYTPQGTSVYLWMPSVAVLTAPTAAEFTAGTRYEAQISGVDGFAPEGATVDFPNAASLETPTIPAPYSLADGTITFNLGKTAAVDARATFKGGIAGVTSTTGVWAFCDEGFQTGLKCRLFACTVLSANPTMEMGAPKTLPVKFALQGHTDYITIPTT